MNLFNLVIKSFRHYFPAHLAVAIGIAISASIITGGMIVGDSVSHSLLETAGYRTGKVTHLVRAGDRFFTRDLAGKLALEGELKTTAVMHLEGIAATEGGGMRLNRIQVWGLEADFNDVAGVMPGLDSLSPGECIISENIAVRLGIAEGDHILLRIRKASQVPANAPFVSDQVQTVSVRVKVKNLAGRDGMGRLNMHVSQTAPYNIFLSLDWMTRILDLDNLCNLVMVSGDEVSTRKLEQSLQDKWTARDASLEIEYLENPGEWKISTKRVFLDDVTSMHLKEILPDAEPVLTYFANSISTEGRTNPYSFVSTLAHEGLKNDEIIINEWLAGDLSVTAGDTVMLKYYVIGPLRTLSEARNKFIIKQVVPFTGRFADRELAPFIPGLSDAGSCSEWEAGVPVDLELIREKDEEYWNIHRGTPKAFISLTTAEGLWQNRFGNHTSFRIPSEMINGFMAAKFPGSNQDNLVDIEQALVSDLAPSQLGFEVVALGDQAIYAASNGVDFSQLFLGLSFFILVSGIILSILLLNYNLMQRSSQTGTLTALGFSKRTIIKIITFENFLVALLGSVLGAFLAILYTKLVFAGLNRVWFDIVRTQVLEVQIKPGTVVLGMTISILVALVSMFFSTRRLLRKKPVEIQKGLSQPKRIPVFISRWVPAGILTAASLILVLIQFLNQQGFNAGIFFIAGGLLLISLLLFSDITLQKMAGKNKIRLGFRELKKRNISFSRGRSMTIIILLALGTFLVVSTGANRKDLVSGALNKTSGTGGFLLFAESTVSLLSSLNDPANRQEQGLMEDFSVVQFRVSEGDDASCLNLNRITNPRIIATDPGQLQDRFTFITSTDFLDPDQPWSSLELEINGVVPAIADQTVIQWGLGKKVGDTLFYRNEAGESLKLLLIGGLAPSVFQGNVIISEKQFLSHFPSSSGSNIFLVEGDPMETESIATDLSATFRDYGWEMDQTATRLAEFNSVSNTYLSIFLIMGAFGLLVGTIGLAIVLVRNIRERRYEIALLSASGFSNRQIKNLFAGEYARLLITGILGGFITAIISTLPVFLTPHSGVSLPFIGGLTAAILLNGLLWIWLLSDYHIRRLKIIDDLRNE